MKKYKRIKIIISLLVILALFPGCGKAAGEAELNGAAVDYETAGEADPNGVTGGYEAEEAESNGAAEAEDAETDGAAGAEESDPNGEIGSFEAEDANPGVSSEAAETEPSDVPEEFSEESGVDTEIGEKPSFPGFYEKLKDGQDVRVLINGDSIAAGNGASDGKAWNDLFRSYIESQYHVNCEMDNISMGGNGSYAGYVRENLLNDSPSYDLVIICYGQNDGRKTVSADYEAIIRTTVRKYPKADIISVLESSQKDYTKIIKTIQKLADHYGIPTADTIAAFNESGIPYEELTVDDKHPNDRGHELYFQEIKRVIEAGKALEVHPNGGDILFDRARLYEQFSWYPAESFEREDEITFILHPGEKVRGIPGLWNSYYPGGGKVKLFMDGEPAETKEIYWPYDFDQEYIYTINDKYREFEASDEIRLVFPSKNFADSFKGMAFSCSND